MTFLKDKTYVKQILSLSIPVALQNLITAVLNIFDQLMVGWLPTSIADYCLSAVLLVNQLVFIFQIVLLAVCNTCNIFLAQYTQNGKEHLIPQRVGFTFAINMAVCIITTAVCYFAPGAVVGLFNPNPEYACYAEQFLKVVSLSFIPMGLSTTFSFVLRAIRKMKLSLVAMTTAVLLNIFLNYVLMFGVLGFPELGFVGAAWGTVISRLVEFVIIFSGMIAFKYPIIASPKKMFVFEKGSIKPFCKLLFPILLTEIFWVLSTTVYLFVYDKLPNSQIALAGYNITSSIDRLVSIATIGIGVAGGILISNCIGDGDDAKLKLYTKYNLQFAFFAGIVVGVISFACAFFVPGFFYNSSEQAKFTAKILLFIFSGTAVFRSLSFMLVIGILRPGGDTTFTMITDIVTTWLFVIPIAVVGGLVWNWSIYLVFSMTMVGEALRCVLYYMRSRNTDRWVKLRT